MVAQKNENSASELSFYRTWQSTHSCGMALSAPSVDGHIAIHVAFEIVGIRQYWILTRAQREFRFL
jgi:hypothetical protein